MSLLMALFFLTSGCYSLAILCNKTVNGAATEYDTQNYTFHLLNTIDITFDSCDTEYDSFLMLYIYMNHGDGWHWDYYDDCDDCGCCCGEYQEIWDVTLNAGTYLIDIGIFIAYPELFQVQMYCLNQTIYYPSNFPSNDPTTIPSYTPTYNPSKDPTFPITANPSTYPTVLPTSNPSTYPTVLPTSNPTVSTNYPSNSPTKQPAVDSVVAETSDGLFGISITLVLVFVGVMIFIVIVVAGLSCYCTTLRIEAKRKKEEELQDIMMICSHSSMISSNINTNVRLDTIGTKGNQLHTTEHMNIDGEIPPHSVPCSKSNAVQQIEMNMDSIQAMREQMLELNSSLKSMRFAHVVKRSSVSEVNVDVDQVNDGNIAPGNINLQDVECVGGNENIDEGQVDINRKGESVDRVFGKSIIDTVR